MATVEYSGPLFDGRAEAAWRAGTDDAEQQLAVEVRDGLRDEVRRQAKTRTGYYESRVRVEVVGGDRVATDAGVIYADWLEGDAPRNARSSFKGFRHWERVHAEVDGRASAVVERALAPYIERMG